MSTPFHRLLFDLVPPFRAIRAPIRWAMVADLGFALLAGVATAALIGAWSQRRYKAFGFGIAACLSGALLFEDRVAPLSLHRGEPDPDPLTRFLKETPMAGGLWEMPDAFNETNAHHVLRAADHWKPLLNGYSGFQTPPAQNLRQARPRGPGVAPAPRGPPFSPRRRAIRGRENRASRPGPRRRPPRCRRCRGFHGDRVGGPDRLDRWAGRGFHRDRSPHRDRLGTHSGPRPRGDRSHRLGAARPAPRGAPRARRRAGRRAAPRRLRDRRLRARLRLPARRRGRARALRGLPRPGRPRAPLPVAEVHMEEGALRSHTVTASARATSVAPRRSEGPPSAKSTTASSRPSRA